MKSLEEKFDKIIWMKMAFSTVFILLGLLVFLKSEMTNRTVGIMMGVCFILHGGICLFACFNKKRVSFFKYDFIFGILYILFGIFVLFSPLSIINALHILLGISLFINGSNQLMYFFNLKRIKEICSTKFLISSIILLLLGFLIIINPFRTILITKTVGLFIILSNIIHINDLLLLRRRGKSFLKMFK